MGFLRLGSVVLAASAASFLGFNWNRPGQCGDDNSTLQKTATYAAWMHNWDQKQGKIRIRYERCPLPRPELFLYFRLIQNLCQ